MKFTVNIIDDFVQSLPYTGLVSCYDVSNGFTTIRTSNIYHLRKGMHVSIDGVVYTVTEVNQSINTFTVEAELNTPLSFIVPPLYYFHGTPVAVNNEISKLDINDKFPAVFLAEILRETERNSLDGYFRESQIRLFFLDYANYRDWSTDNHYTQVLTGLNKAVDVFVSSLQSYPKFIGYDTDITRINHVKFGAFTEGFGHTQSIFSEHLSGVELTFNLKIKRDCLIPETLVPLCADELTLSADSYTLKANQYQWQH